MQVCDLFSTQEEADTRIILHCLYDCQQQRSGHIVVHSQDTDVFLLLLAYEDEMKTFFFVIFILIQVMDATDVLLTSLNLPKHF